MTTLEREESPSFRAPFPLVEAKLRPAVPRPGTVPRTRLVGLLDAEPGRRVISIVAPPGYGKTTLLAQWTAQARLPVAWLTLDDVDNDPSILVAYLAAALDPIEPVGADLARTLTGSGKRILATAVPRLVSALHAWRRPALLVVDDAHRLVDRSSLDALVLVVDYLPPGFRVAFAARSEPDLPLARLRVQGDLLELTPQHLALDEAETVALAASVGCELAPEEAQQLVDRTEGWPAGVYLTALARAHGNGTGSTVLAATEGDRHIAAYLRSEVERRLRPDDLAFLARTAILDTVEPATAETVTQMPGAADRLRRISQESLFVSDSGAAASTYRYHNLLRDFLRAELDLLEPALVPELHRRAAAAYAAAGRIDAAVEHALAGGHREAAAAYVVGSTLDLFNRGRISTLDRWLSRFTMADHERYPPLAAMATWIHFMAGRAGEADRMADIVDRSVYDGPSGDGSASFASQRAILRAILCRNGPRDMLANATLAVSLEGPGSPWRSHALLVEGAARYLLGEADRAAAQLDESTRVGLEAGAPTIITMVTRAGLWLREGAVERADRLAEEAFARVVAARLEETVQSLATNALRARLALAAGDAGRAKDALVRAQLLRPLASAATPWISVGALLDLARAYLAISDVAGAQVVLREAELIVRVRPGLGILTDDLVALRRQLAGASVTLAGSSALTAAELRVLALLPTYLSFQEIAERLQISRNTVKTHAVAIYGKLWASSRGEAVERAVELGLLEPYPVLVPPGAPARGRDA